MCLPAIDTSIVLATCSRAGMLRGALRSLLAEAAAWPKPAEMIVVDDGSTDDTAEVLAEFQQSSPVPFTVLQGECQGVAAARNTGVRHARGVWLASFDDDQIAQPGWLSALRELADTTGSVCIGGALALDLPPGTALSEFGPRARRILGEHLDGDVAKPCSLRPASNNVLIRHDVFSQLGGYDQTFTEGAEDADLFDRIAAGGHTMWFQPAARALHITPESRLQQANFRWTSLRIGASDARRHTRRGKLSLMMLLATRAAITIFRDLPQLAYALALQNTRLRLDVQCSFWYTLGLLRAAPAFLGVRQGESRFLRSLDFRARNGERRDGTVRPAKDLASRPQS